MGNVGTSHQAPPRLPVPEGLTRVCVAGYKISPPTGHARALAALIAKKHSKQYESWFYFDNPSSYYFFLKETFDPVPFPDHLKGHATSPFVWLETQQEGKTVIEPIGGNDRFCAWALEKFPSDQEVKTCASTKPGFYNDLFHNGIVSYGFQPTADTGKGFQ